MTGLHKLALVKLGKYTNGGVSSVCRFIYDTVTSTNRYAVDLISLDASSNGSANVRVSSPRSWFRGIQTEDYTWNNVPAKHFGALFSEFETQRYMPRSLMTNVLNSYDIVQVVAGSPALAYATKDVDKPVCLFVATLVVLERTPTLRNRPFLKKLYGYAILPLVDAVDKCALRCVDHVFAETLYTKEAILPYIDEDKITIDTIGIDVDRFVPAQTRSDAYILSTGRLSDPRKNVSMLFRAYARVRKQLPNAPKLLLAGVTGPTESDWQLAKKLGVFEFIEFRQSIPREEMVALYQNAALFLLSSHEEGLGIVLLEAMACATPVVSTRCGGPDSVVSEDVGFLVPVGDAEAMAAKIVWMLQNPHERRQMGEAGRTMVERRFSNQVVGKKYLDVYDKLLGLNYP